MGGSLFTSVELALDDELAARGYEPVDGGLGQERSLIAAIHYSFSVRYRFA